MPYILGIALAFVLIWIVFILPFRIYAETRSLGKAMLPIVVTGIILFLLWQLFWWAISDGGRTYREPIREQPRHESQPVPMPMPVPLPEKKVQPKPVPTVPSRPLPPPPPVQPLDTERTGQPPRASVAPEGEYLCMARDGSTITSSSTTPETYGYRCEPNPRVRQKPQYLCRGPAGIFHILPTPRSEEEGYVCEVYRPRGR